VKPEGERLDFLGYTFRWERDLKGRSMKYLNVLPSAKALAREREKLLEMTSTSQSHTPIPQLVERLNRHLRGWANYFSFGYPRAAYWEIDWFVRGRLIGRLQRRSQRPYRPPPGVPWYDHLQKFGLVPIGTTPQTVACACPRRLSSGEPDAGNLHVRLCVQRRLACSVGVNPTGVKVKAP